MSEVQERPQRTRPRRAPSAARESEPTREGFRLLVPDEGVTGLGVRAVADGTPEMFGHFAVFDRWTEIDSFFEGRFLERIAPGAFKKTFQEQRDGMRVLFNHGRDPQLANQVLGPIRSLQEDETGAAYEVPLFRGIPDLIMEGLRAGVYGASFRFRATREDVVRDPEPSEDNPSGLQERTIREAQVFEFGPVTFPAYKEATAGVRSVTDDYFWDMLASGDPEALTRMASGDGESSLLQRFIEYRFNLGVSELAAEEQEDDAAPADEAVPVPSKSVRNAAPGHRPTQLLGVRKEQWRL